MTDDQEAYKVKANDLFHFLTWRSPLRTKRVREVTRRFAALMRASTDPGLIALGLATEALVDQFEKRK